ncbi:MAG: hypothetical protein WDN25_05835 [Acetobacteraceae bacterium]
MCPASARCGLPVDALSVRHGNGEFRFIERRDVAYPPVQRQNAAVTYYAGMATLAELAVDTANGKVELLSHHSILECGNLVVPEPGVGTDAGRAGDGHRPRAARGAAAV